MLIWLKLFLLIVVLPFMAGFAVGLLFWGVEAIWDGMARWRTRTKIRQS